MGNLRSALGVQKALCDVRVALEREIQVKLRDEATAMGQLFGDVVGAARVAVSLMISKQFSSQSKPAE